MINNLLDIKPEIRENGMFVYPCISVSPVRSTVYTNVVNEWGEHWNKVHGIKPPSNNKGNGFISKKGQSNLEKAVYHFLYSVDPAIVNEGKNKHKVTFLTLTLPSSQKKQHSDKDIKEQCLNQFLTEIRTEFQVSKYIWKCEKQEKGDFHIHLLTDKFLPWREMRTKWNRICNKLGYVYEYHKRFKDLSFTDYRKIRLQESKYKGKLSQKQEQEIKRAFKKGHETNWMDPNSVDVESLRKAGNVAAYVSKYMSKEHKESANLEDLKVDGRIWYSSQAIAKMKNLIIELIDRDNYVNEFKAMLDTYQDEIFEGQYTISLGVPVDRLKRKGFDLIPNDFHLHCEIMYGRSVENDTYQHRENVEYKKELEIRKQKQECEKLLQELIKKGKERRELINNRKQLELCM